MALSRERLEQLRDALLEARFQGELTISYRDAETGQQVMVTHRSDEELARAIADCERRIAALSTNPAVSFIRFIASKGL